MVLTRPTKLGRVFLVLMLLFYGAAVTSQSGLLLLLIGLIGGCFVVNWSFSRRSVAHLLLSAPRQLSLVEGSALGQPWTLENHYTKHIEMIEARSESALLFRIPLVAVGDVVTVLPKLVFQRRGVYPHSRVTISSAAPFGLLNSERRIDLPGEVVVLPRAYDTTSPAGTGLDFAVGGRFRGSRRTNSGAHFAGVRPWQPGDALKQVHWKTTARRGELMVKSFEEELAGRVTLLLDCEPDRPATVDDAARAAASVAIATLQEGHQLEFVIAGDPDPLRLPPFSDEGELLDRLARYAPARNASETDLNCFWRKSAIAIVGTRFRAPWLTLIQQAEAQNRSVHVYVQSAQGVPKTCAELWEYSANAIKPVEQTAALPS